MARHKNYSLTLERSKVVKKIVVTKFKDPVLNFTPASY